ncbi:MAG: YjbH domain-containing protein [Sulfitobacter sp.]
MAQDRDVIFGIQHRPSLSFYGAPGLIDMPSGEALLDGQVAVGISYFGGQSRTTLTFQATPRIQASFRYAALQDLNIGGFETFRDRSFDLRFLAAREGRWRPAVTIGLQDFAGTGIYAGEFVATTKRFEGNQVLGTLKVTIGLGWGRFGSAGSIGAPFSTTRPSFQVGDTGGEPSFDQWFRGNAAPFAGVEWQVTDKFGLKAEYSSDAYEVEVRQGVIAPRSRFNFGLEYQINETARLGGYYLYGSEIGVNLQIQLNPQRPLVPLRIPAPRPFDIRPDRDLAPLAYSESWAIAKDGASDKIHDALRPLMAAEGLTLLEVKTSASSTEVRYRNDRFLSMALSVGRVARVMARALPASVEVFQIVPVVNNLAQSTITTRRSDLEILETSPDAVTGLLAVSEITDAPPILFGSSKSSDLYPTLDWSFGPYVQQSLFDPNEPLRADVGIEADLALRPAAGLTIAGNFRHRFGGNISGASSVNTSVIPQVRTNAVLYAQGGDTSVTNLYVSKQWKMAPDIYARLTAGHLERMFGGLSAEMLWKPVASKLALGVEANYVRQRAFDSILGLQDYSVLTGHASAYYEFGNGYLGQLDVGRYLAGDMGATVTLAREFSNGWRIGGFFTLTDVSAADFGEGSFDKGIQIAVPVQWLIGRLDRRVRSTTLRPLLRDGGARLIVPDRLYEQVRRGHRTDLVRNWSGVWQ